ncbi:IclR family transcriptional regulator [Variovorax sp. VNK109]|uniref:IclR family transcriptional regulator n=1 Tax=Variovorax sp. VNK109 TaxID=3400919 RepID=UPI003C0AC91A
MGNDGVTAVERALGLLDCFRPGEESLTLAAFASRVKLHKTTIYRLLNSLTRMGYVLRQPGGAYTLGPRVLYLGRVYELGFQMSDWVVPRLRELSQATDETASYYVESAGQRMCLFRIQPREGLHQHVLAGSLLPFDDSSTGQVFRHWGLQGAVHLGVPAPALPVQTSGVRDSFTASMCVPVFGQDDQFVGAMTLSGLRDRVEQKRPAFVAALLQQADSLSAALGASPAQRALLLGGLPSTAPGKSRKPRKLRKPHESAA